MAGEAERRRSLESAVGMDSKPTVDADSNFLLLFSASWGWSLAPTALAVTNDRGYPHTEFLGVTFGLRPT